MTNVPPITDNERDALFEAVRDAAHDPYGERGIVRVVDNVFTCLDRHRKAGVSWVAITQTVNMGFAAVGRAETSAGTLRRTFCRAVKKQSARTLQANPSSQSPATAPAIAIDEQQLHARVRPAARAPPTSRKPKSKAAERAREMNKLNERKRP